MVTSNLTSIWFSSTSLLVLYLLSLQLFSTLDTRILALLCSTPILSDIADICDARQVSQAKADFGQLIVLQSGFADTIEQGLVKDMTLAFSANKAKRAVRDLSIQVRASDLVVKDDLADRLEEFVDGAYGVTKYLHNLTARATGAIDQ